MKYNDRNTLKHALKNQNRPEHTYSYSQNVRREMKKKLERFSVHIPNKQWWFHLEFQDRVGVMMSFNRFVDILKVSPKCQRRSCPHNGFSDDKHRYSSPDYWYLNWHGNQWTHDYASDDKIKKLEKKYAESIEDLDNWESEWFKFVYGNFPKDVNKRRENALKSIL